MVVWDDITAIHDKVNFDYTLLETNVHDSKKNTMLTIAVIYYSLSCQGVDMLGILHMSLYGISVCSGTNGRVLWSSNGHVKESCIIVNKVYISPSGTRKSSVCDWLHKGTKFNLNLKDYWKLNQLSKMS